MSADRSEDEEGKSLSLRLPFFLLLWIDLLDLPHDIASVGNDTSWQRCLGYFLTHRFQCGVDYVWTYGPLGYFVNMVYDTDLFWWKYAWELAVKFAFTWILLRWARLLCAGWMRATFLGLVLYSLAGSVDTLYLFCLILMGLLPLRDAGCRTSSRLLAGTGLMAILSLTKFTFLLVGVGAWGVVLCAPGLTWRRRFVVAMGYPLSVVLLWMLLGQSLDHLPRFVASYLEVARGYGEAMAKEGRTEPVYLGLAAGVSFLLLASVRPFSVLRRRENLLGIALLCAGTFMVWKHGFIRQDFHTTYFFGFLVVVPFAAEGLLGGPKTKPIRVLLLATTIVLGFLGRGIPLPVPWAGRLLTNGIFALAPTRLARSLEVEQKLLADEWALPKICSIVGDRPVDLLTYSQGVLFLNHLNYHPRPIFQSYSAYTPDLIEVNAGYYRGERAPDFVLCRLEPIDNRFPAMEDSAALLEILRRYRFVAGEKGLLLLERREDKPRSAADPPLLLQKDIAFDEAIRLDEFGASSKLLSIHVTDTFRGRLTKALFRSTHLSLDVTTTDGEKHSFRLIPNMAETSFLVDPLLRNHDDLESYFLGKPLPRIRMLSIHAGPEARNCFENRLSIAVRSFQQE